MKLYNEMNLRGKLLSVMFLISSLFFLAGIYSVYNISLMKSEAETMFEEGTKSFVQVSQIAERFQRIRVIIRDVLIDKDESVRDKHKNNLETLQEQIRESSAIVSKSIRQEEEKRIWKDLQENQVTYFSKLENYLSLLEKNEDSLAYAFLRGDWVDNATRQVKLVDELVKEKEKISQQLMEKYNDKSENSQIVLLVSSIIILLLSVFLAVKFSSSIAENILLIINQITYLSDKTLKNLEKGSIKFTEGELNIVIDSSAELIKLDRKDELGQLVEGINKITHSTQSSVQSVQMAMHSVKSAIAEINRLVTAVIKGNISERGDIGNLKGGFKEIIVGLNQTLEAFQEPITEQTRVLTALSQGRLTERMEKEYSGDFQKTKENINALAESFEKAIAQVKIAVQSTTEASSQISASSEQMAAGAQEQSSQTMEIAGAVEEMTRTILENAKNISHAADLSKSTQKEVKKGSDKVQETKKGMEQIVHLTSATGNQVSSLASKADQIGEIIQVIDDIADQTNLLALNAAIEAARAGEQGRGFAVVADEVRKLAERTTKATKEIEQTIKLIQTEVKSANDAMEDAKKAVENGMTLTGEISVALIEIERGTNNVTDTISQVAAASEEQASTAEEISKNVEGISSVAQESAAGIEEIANAAEGLNNLTLNLREVVSQFQITSDNVKQVSDSRNGRNKYLN